MKHVLASLSGVLFAAVVLVGPIQAAEEKPLPVSLDQPASQELPVSQDPPPAPVDADPSDHDRSPV